MHVGVIEIIIVNFCRHIEFPIYNPTFVSSGNESKQNNVEEILIFIGENDTWRSATCDGY